MTSLFTKLIDGCGRTITVGEVVKMYRDIVNVSVPESGKIQQLGTNVFSLTNQFRTIDCDTLEAIKTFKVYSLSTTLVKGSGVCIDAVRCISDIHDSCDIVSATSNNGRFLARIKSRDNGAGQDGQRRQLLEIWDRSKLIKTIDTSELHVHGSINTDSVFANFTWSPSGEQDKLLYVCQPKRPKHMSFFKEAASRPDNQVKVEREDPTDSDSASRGEEYMRRKDWGECLTGIEHTMIGILDVSADCNITTIEAAGHSLGSPSWLDGGSKVISVAYQEDPRSGIIFCNNNKSKILVHDWLSSNEPVLELDSSTDSLHCPRVNHLGDKFVYLSNTTDGAHKHSVKLNLYDFRTRSNTVLVDEESKKAEFYIENLPKNCFTTDDKNILFTQTDYWSSHLNLFSLEGSKLSRIEFPTTEVSILDFRHDIILATGSEINATSTIFVAALNLQNTGDVVGWHQIEDCTHLDEVNYETFKIPTSDGSFISTIFVEPDIKVMQQKSPGITMQTSQLPTVVLVHGGPHSAFIQRYLPVLIFHARLGLKTLLINYRGSTGVSEEYSRSLCGKIGEQDVDDCLLGIRYFVENKKIDPSKLIIKGGSHGGFLSCHLSCQEEFKFTSAIIGNPVVDLLSMRLTSDITEWVYAEGLGFERPDMTHTLSPEHILQLYKLSPSSIVSKANVPTLMLLGNKDRRVRMFQGELWLEGLRANGVETMCKVYNDKHSLDKPETAADVAVTSAIWMLNHLPK